MTDTSTRAIAKPVANRWRTLATLTGVTVVDSTEAGMVNTLFPSIAAALRLDNSHLGIMSALGKIAAVPAGPFWVWLSTKIGRRAVLALTTLTGGMFGIVTGFSQDFVQLVIFATLMTACLIGGTPIANAVIADSFDDRDRAKATGIFYGAVSAIASFAGPLIALFTGLTDGWRYGMWAIGVVCLIASAIVWALFRDPGIGASDDNAPATSAVVLKKVSLRDVLTLFRIPTFSVMMLSRLLSGHLLIMIFGIQFLVTERGFDNAAAAIVLVPFGVGYVVGTIGGGFTVPVLDRLMGLRGRVLFIQLAQIVFAVAAFFGTQYVYDGIAIYCVFWALMGLGQGMNPPVNRPIVSAVVAPRLRGQAFAIWLTGFETIAWAIFSLGAGALADALGLQSVFLYVLVVAMALNALVLSALYWTYPRDAARITGAA